MYLRYSDPLNVLLIAHFTLCYRKVSKWWARATEISGFTGMWSRNCHIFRILLLQNLQICPKIRRIGCVIPPCNLQHGITQPILQLFWHICTLPFQGRRRREKGRRVDHQQLQLAGQQRRRQLEPRQLQQEGRAGDFLFILHYWSPVRSYGQRFVQEKMTI